MRTGVAMAVYNGKDFLTEQLDSLLNQTCPPDVIVICDDGSTDGSMDLIENYIREKGEESRFLTVKNDRNLGYAQNFYKAMTLCDADLLFLCDQDDVWETTKIEEMTKLMAERVNCQLVTSAYTLINESGAFIDGGRYAQVTGEGNARLLSISDVVSHFNYPGMTMAIRRTFFGSIREKASKVNAPHDRVLSLLAAEQSGFVYYDKPLSRHRMHSNNAGGEQNSSKVYLSRSYKLKELGKSHEWLKAQIDSNCFSADAIRSLEGYAAYIAGRIDALEHRSLLRLTKTALRGGEYRNIKGVLADAYVILTRKA